MSKPKGHCRRGTDRMESNRQQEVSRGRQYSKDLEWLDIKELSEVLDIPQSEIRACIQLFKESQQ